MHISRVYPFVRKQICMHCSPRRHGPIHLGPDCWRPLPDLQTDKRQQKWAKGQTGDLRGSIQGSAPRQHNWDLLPMLPGPLKFIRLKNSVLADIADKWSRNNGVHISIIILRSFSVSAWGYDPSVKSYKDWSKKIRQTAHHTIPLSMK